MPLRRPMCVSTVSVCLSRRWRQPEARLQSVGSSWPTPGRGATRWWTGNCTCPRPGPATWRACKPWAWPRDTPLATKPELARALDAGLPVAWVTGDSVYGYSADLRQELEARGQSYVLAVAGNEHVWVGFRQVPVGDLWAALPEADWETLACGLGAKGSRVHDWQCRVLAEPEDAEWGRYVLFRARLHGPRGRVPGLSRVCGPTLCPGDPGGRGRHPLVHRERLRGRQAGDGTGRVRGAQRHRLVPPPSRGPSGPWPCWPCCARPRCRRPRPRSKKSPPAAWPPSNAPAGWRRPEPGGRAVAVVGGVAARRTPHPPRPGLAGLGSGYTPGRPSAATTAHYRRRAQSAGTISCKSVGCGCWRR